MPTNLYGPRDNYHPDNSHVIPALIHRFHDAKLKNLKRVTVWGTGEPRREFLYVDDMARASIFLMNINKKVFNKHVSLRCNHINVGSGEELTIKELALEIKEIVGFKGDIVFDKIKPNGIMRKSLDNEILKKLNFKLQTSLKVGLIKTYKDYIMTSCK